MVHYGFKNSHQIQVTIGNVVSPYSVSASAQIMFQDVVLLHKCFMWHRPTEIQEPSS